MTYFTYLYGRTLADDLRENPRPVDPREHVHFHEHGGERHAHVHRNGKGDDHAHSTITSLPRHAR